MLVGENLGEFSYLDYLGEKTLVNSLFQINNYGDLSFRKIEGENFGDWPSICQICQCFLPPAFSAIQYHKNGVSMVCCSINNIACKQFN